jgi:hypothetical protein
MATMKTTLSIVFLAAALAFAGCKKKEEPASNAMGSGTAPAATAPATPAAPTPAAPTPAAPAAGGDMIASDDDYLAKANVTLDKMTNVIKSAGSDCDKLAAELEKFTAENKGLLKAAAAYETAHPEAKKKFDDANKDKMAAFQAAADPAFTACQGNKKVGEAMAKMAE